MPEPESGLTFSLEEAMRAQGALRQSLGLGPEQFPLAAFVGMISDEIQGLREAGRSDDEIASLIRTATDRTIDPADLARFYATPAERHAHGKD